LLSISVGVEYVVPPRPQFSLPGGDICPLWKGLTVGANYRNPGINVYLTPAGEGWITSRTVSKVSGKPRVLSAHRKLGNGEVVVIVALEWSWDWGRTDGAWFDDDNFSIFDNDKASVALFSWLAGLSEYPPQELEAQPVDSGTGPAVSRVSPAAPQSVPKDDTAMLTERLADLERQFRASLADQDRLRRELDASHRQARPENGRTDGAKVLLSIVAGVLFLTTLLLLWSRNRRLPPNAKSDS
jgi:hypothetical protein